jgi:hypothetical protein
MDVLAFLGEDVGL